VRSFQARTAAPGPVVVARALSFAIVLMFLIALSGLLVSGCSSDVNASGSADRVARGKYIVDTGACNDCHTPWKMGPNGPEPDMTRYLSGHPGNIELTPPGPLPEGWGVAISATNTAFSGPWGISYTANLTPDDTGLGVWTEDIFIKALRSGKHMGAGRDILPLMPWPAYSQMTDEDLRSIFAYLQTIPPVENVVPQPVPPAQHP